MVKVTAQMVKELREATGAGPLDIKKALEANDGDKQAAIDYLREKGMASAAKKLGKERTMNEGTVAVWKDEDSNNPAKVAMVQVDCETDFVGTNDKFVAFSEELAAHVAQVQPADVDTLMGQALTGADVNVDERLKEVIAELGEKMQVGGIASVEANGGTIGIYQHFNKRVAALVKLDKAGLDDLAYDIAMHLSNLRPQYISRDEVPAAEVEHERTVQKNRVIEEGKPEHVADKIVTGRMDKWYGEIVLLEQPFLKDDSKTIAQLVEETGAQVVKMVRFAVGEGDNEGDDE